MAEGGAADDNLTQELQPCNGQGGAMVENNKQQQALMPASIQAENVNLGQTQNVVTGDQTYIQHVERNIERHIETNIEKQVVYNIGEQGNIKDIPEFDLESVRRQLINEYLETRGKLPLLPGMPEEFAKMEDIFVDLDIIEEDKKPSGVISKKLKSHSDIVCIERQIEMGARKESQLVKRILVRGGPGAGKSSTVSKLAYDWACGKQNSPISRFQLLFALTINEINTNTDLIGIIQDQLLPKVSRQGLEDYLQSNASSVVILFDGYDEASEHFHLSKDIKNVLCSKWLAETCVIVTTRPNQVGRFSDNYGSYLQVEIKGFSGDDRKTEYVQKFMGAQRSNASAFLNHLFKSPQLQQLASIPIILSMLCLLWIEDGKLPLTITALYNEVIMHLAKHAKYTKKCIDVSYDQKKIDRLLGYVGKVAIDGLFDDRLVFKSDKFEETVLGEACSLGIVTKEKKRSRFNATYHVTFLHKTFQEVCAAYYWTKLIDVEMETFKKYLKQVTNDNIFEMEYLLRFACGLSVKAAEVILPHVVQIICLNELEDYEDNLENIFENVCQQMPLFLLYEAESNNTEMGHYNELHMQLKPLFKTVIIGSPGSRPDEFQEVITTYISSQQLKSDSNSHGHSWLDGVEKVVVVNDSNDDDDVDGDDVDDDVDMVFNLLCTISRISTSLSELHFTNSICCEANRFSQFLSIMPSLTKLVLYWVSLSGELSNALTLPEVKELDIDYSQAACKAIMSGFSEAADIIEQQNMTQSHSSGKTTDVETCIPIEIIQIEQFYLEPVDVWNLAKAIKYMLHLRTLTLLVNDLGPDDCDMLFDAFIEASKNMHMYNHKNQSSSDVRHDRCLLLEELDLSGHVIGESIGKFVKAYGYMSHLRCLKLSCVTLTCHHCEKLFDGFIEVGQTRDDGLALQILNLSGNEIGDSAGKLAQAYRCMTCLRCLYLSRTHMNPSQCAQLFDGFLTTGELKEKQQEKKPGGMQQRSMQSDMLRENGLMLEELYISGNDIGDSVGKLAQAYRYMTSLKCLDLANTQLNPSQCAVLFDGFITAGKMLTQQDETSSNTQGDASGTSQSGLRIQDLNLSGNEIGDSVRKLAQAYRYMKSLRCLDLVGTKLNPSQCAVLFDGFITAGKMSIHQNETSSYTQGDTASTSQSGLRIQDLGLSDNEIGESVDKLLEALRYMPHLKELNMENCQLSEESMEVIYRVSQKYLYHFIHS
ncbi:uncharacterized protein [Amphiura filiformis]|uniref:uncharacterized protein n=1 Tax=Amphiura filiformis TaxID=82378 RepID=UPI003B2280FA